MATVLTFGNELVQEDSMAKRIGRKLGLEVVECDSADCIMDYHGEKDIYLLDVVQNIQDVTVIDDPSDLDVNRLFSLHDFDLGFLLKLLKTTGKLDRIKIIGVPPKGNLSSLSAKVRRIIKEDAK